MSCPRLVRIHREPFEFVWLRERLLLSFRIGAVGITFGRQYSTPGHPRGHLTFAIVVGSFYKAFGGQPWT